MKDNHQSFCEVNWVTHALILSACHASPCRVFELRRMGVCSPDIGTEPPAPQGTGALVLTSLDAIRVGIYDGHVEVPRPQI